MARHTESLGLGLFTAPNPAVLEPGQLSFLQNGVYLPGSMALQRARGRAVFGSATADATDVDGLRDIQFDNGDHYLVAMISGTATGNGFYRTASVEGVGTFSTLSSGFVAGTQLEAIHYRNRFYLLNGVQTAATALNSNTVVYLSATATGTSMTTRQHGMLPVKDTPNVTTGAGSFSQTITGYYEYWTTEVAKLTQDGTEMVLESTFIGTPYTVLVSSTAVVPTIQQPPIRNSIATHWRIYRSPKKELLNDKKFPSGFMVAEVGSATAQQVDGGGGTTTSYTFPASFNSGVTQRYNGAGWATVSGLTADGGSEATVTDNANPLIEQAQGCYGFNFGGFSGNIVGIEVEVQGYVATGSAPIPLSVTIGSKRQSNGEYLALNGVGGGGVVPVSKSCLISSTAAGSPTTVVLGGSADPWTAPNLPRFSDLDFDANFMVVLKPSFLFTASTVLALDYVKARVTYGATLSGDSAVQFPSVVYTFGDISAQVGKNGLPPSSSTGEIYEDALVVNDVSNKSLIRYSAPGEPESFPETYFIDFETQDNDNVTNIKVVNGRLMAMLSTSVARVNYLPSERDSSFDRGKAFDWVSRSYGCVNAMCACVFSRDGGTETLAFVSDHGIHGTDGYNFDTYTDGLDWSQIISRTSTSNSIALVNDRDRQELLFYYRNDAITNETYRCLHLSYAAEHWNGKPKISGPVNMRNFLSAGSLRASLESAWTARRTSGAQDVFLGYGGTATGAGAGMVYRETGTTIPAQDDRLAYATRRMYLAGLGNEWRMNDVYGLVGSYTSTPTVSYTVNGAKTNDAGATALGTKTLTLGGQLLHRVNFQVGSEGMIITGYATASAYAQESLIIDGENFGMEDSGR